MKMEQMTARPGTRARETTEWYTSRSGRRARERTPPWRCSTNREPNHAPPTWASASRDTMPVDDAVSIWLQILGVGWPDDVMNSTTLPAVNHEDRASMMRGLGAVEASMTQLGLLRVMATLFIETCQLLQQSPHLSGDSVAVRVGDKPMYDRRHRDPAEESIHMQMTLSFTSARRQLRGLFAAGGELGPQLFSRSPKA